MANGPRYAPCSDQTTKIPDKRKYYRARPRPLSSGAENQRTVRNFGLLPREVPLSLRGSRIPPLPLHPAMAGLTQQPPRDTGPSPNTLPTGTTSWQVSLTQSAPPGPTIRSQAASPSNPSQLAPICIWVGEGAWRQSRRVGELLRGYVSFSLLLSPLPRATFPSYDLCFPALPVKKGVGTSRGGGPTIQAGC